MKWKLWEVEWKTVLQKEFKIVQLLPKVLGINIVNTIMPLSICSDSEDDVERPQSAKTSIDLSSMPWPNNIVNLEDVSRFIYSWYFKSSSFNKN